MCLPSPRELEWTCVCLIPSHVRLRSRGWRLGQDWFSPAVWRPRQMTGGQGWQTQQLAFWLPRNRWASYRRSWSAEPDAFCTTRKMWPPWWRKSPSHPGSAWVVLTSTLWTLSACMTDMPIPVSPIPGHACRLIDSPWATLLSSKLSSVVCCCCSVAQLCLTLCDPIDWGLPGFHVHGISHGQEYWSGLPFSSLVDLLDPEIEPMSPALAG